MTPIKRRHQEVPAELSRSEQSSAYEEDSFIASSEEDKEYSSTARIETSEIVKKLRRGALSIQDKKPSKKEKVPADLNIGWKTDVCYRLGVKAKEAHVCHVVGRNSEVAEIMRFLAQPTGGMRPLLIGPKGIGKKAIVRKVAFEIEHKRCPPQLFGKSLFIIDGTNLQGLRVSSEGRGVLSEYLRHELETTLKENLKPILYFRDIDKILEVEGLSEFLKTLFKSNLNAIASFSGEISEEDTTKYTRELGLFNFIPVQVNELSREEAAQVVSHQLKKHPLPDCLILLPEAEAAAVRLSGEYIKGRPYPLKTLQLIHKSANDVYQRYIQPKVEPKKKVKAQITPESIARTVSLDTKIPEDYLTVNDSQLLTTLQKRLNEQIIGQQKAIATVCSAIHSDKMGFNVDFSKPRGAFLLIGSTGVGKTELARCLAQELFFDKSRMIRFDMSEFKESHNVSRLIGSPPGYIGYEQGGHLCEALRKQPHSIVLLDEFEKAHEDVRQVFLQVFDEGRLTDGKGNTVDCTKAIFLMTSNLGSELLLALVDEKKEATEENVFHCIESLLLEKLTPEFCNRLTAIVPFASLKKKDIPQVVEVQLKRLQQQFLQHREIQLTWEKSALDLLSQINYNPKLGMRTIAKEVSNQVAHALTQAQEREDELLRGKLKLVCEKGKLVIKK